MMELVGQAAGSQDVEIRARVEGYLDTVAFAEGSLVKKGQLLYQIDPKPFQAALANAKAEPRHGAGPATTRASNDVKRFEPLVAQAGRQPAWSSTTPSRRATPRSPRWRRTRRPSTRRSSTSATPRSRRRSTGSSGTTKVKAGNLVGRGESTLLVTISLIDPILFRAGIGEAEYLRIVAAVPGAARPRARRARRRPSS